MDDAAKRRELRRRKILANAEDRMKKVMGTYGGADGKTEDPKPTADDGRTIIEDTEGSQPLLPVKVNEAQHNAGVNATASTTSATTNANADLDTVPDSTPILEKIAEGLPDPLHSGETKGEAAPDTSQRIVWTTSVQRVVTIVVLASVVCAWLNFFPSTYSLLFWSQSIVVPFVLFEIVVFKLFLWHQVVSQPGGGQGSLLSSALLLNGVNKDLIRSFNIAQGVFDLILNDGALFFCIFILLQWCLSGRSV